MNFCQLTTGNRQLSSTSAERAQKNLFMQNKPNFPRFCAKNEDFAQKQTQFKPNSNPIQTQSKPIQTQFKPNFNPNMPKTNPIKPNQTQFQTILSRRKLYPPTQKSGQAPATDNLFAQFKQRRSFWLQSLLSNDILSHNFNTGFSELLWEWMLD